MPNWIEGTMKLRGKRSDIKRFFEEGVTTSTYLGEEQITDRSDKRFHMVRV